MNCTMSISQYDYTLLREDLVTYKSTLPILQLK
jgi:hypothetical protein